MSDRFDVTRTIPADAAAIFSVLCDPHGHLAIDSSGMIMAAATSYYDWSNVDPVWIEREFPGMGTVLFPVIPEATLRATLGILERTVVKG